jgi:cytochrome c biogenesis protein CcmG, thiol:disulfide interchange protein DsbE
MRLFRVGAQALSVGLVAALLALLVWKVSHQIGNETVASEVQKGKQPAAPAFDLERLDRDGRLRSESLEGKVVVINFWASWCVPCREEAALLDQTWKDARSRGVVVVGVDHQDAAQYARAFAERYGMTYPLVRDTGDHLYDKYGATGVPESFFVTREGRVVAHVPGAVTRETLAAGLREAGAA